MDDSKPLELTRRRVIELSSVAGGLGLAGCTGGGGGGDDGGQNSGGGSGSGDGEGGEQTADYGGELTMATNGEGTAVYAASQVVSATVNERSEQIQLEALPTSGPAENVGRMSRKEAAAGQITDWVKSQVIQGNEPYTEMTFEPQQLFSVYVVPWVFVTTDPEIKSITDIGPDTDILAGQVGEGQDLFRRALELYDVTDYNAKEIQYDQQASAFADGRIDVGLTNILNPPVDRAIEPGWVQEIKSTAGPLGVVSWPDGGERLVEDDVLQTTKWDVGKYDEEYSQSAGYDQYEPPNPYTSVTASYNFVARDDVPRDLVYNMLSTMHEHVDQLAEGHALLEFYKQDDVWVLGAWDDVPFHPGAADLYEELGVWNDEWTRG